jgi:hypothetical protein
LQALHDIEVDYVNAIAALKSFKDCLVGGEVSKFDKRRDIVKDLEGAMNALMVD